MVLVHTTTLHFQWKIWFTVLIGKCYLGIKSDFVFLTKIWLYGFGRNVITVLVQNAVLLFWKKFSFTDLVENVGFRIWREYAF